MTKSPLEMSIKELDATYGKPKKVAAVTAVLGLLSNMHHDMMTVEFLTDNGERILVPFAQSTIRELIRLCGDEASSADRPKTN